MQSINIKKCHKLQNFKFVLDRFTIVRVLNVSCESENLAHNSEGDTVHLYQRFTFRMTLAKCFVIVTCSFLSFISDNS